MVNVVKQTDQAATAASNPPALGGAENLDDLAGLAQGLDAPAAGAPGAAGAPVATLPDTLEDDLMDVLCLVREGGGMLADMERGIPPERIEQIWTDKKLRAIAKPAAEICRRHGWDVEFVVAGVGPYLALAFATVVPLMDTVKLVRTAPKPIKPEPAPADAPAPDQGGAGGQ